MVWQLLDCSPNDATALQGTMLLNLLALERGADILRVHDVKEAADTIKVYEALKP
jgi:dihydropteroate synthase